MNYLKLFYQLTRLSLENNYSKKYFLKVYPDGSLLSSDVVDQIYKDKLNRFICFFLLNNGRDDNGCKNRLAGIHIYHFVREIDSYIDSNTLKFTERLDETLENLKLSDGTKYSEYYSHINSLLGGDKADLFKSFIRSAFEIEKNARSSRIEHSKQGTTFTFSEFTEYRENTTDLWVETVLKVSNIRGQAYHNFVQYSKIMQIIDDCFDYKSDFMNGDFNYLLSYVGNQDLSTLIDRGLDRDLKQHIKKVIKRELEKTKSPMRPLLWIVFLEFLREAR